MKRLNVLIVLLVMVSLGTILFQDRIYQIKITEIRKTESSTQSWLRAYHGHKLYSQNDEELVIRDFFNDRKGRVFLDVGANHYKTNSTTYYLEEQLDWSGVAVDALSEFEADYLTHRPKSQYFAFYVSDISDDEVDFFVNLRNTRVSSSDKKFADSFGSNRTERIITITLDDLFAQLKIEKIDLLSMDIELAEPKALAGFDIKKFRPSLVCIEIHEEVAVEIREYMAENDYVEIEKYRGLDRLNAYFTPRTMIN